MLSKRWIACVALVLQFGMTLPFCRAAYATILLKPKGETASALRIKSLDAQVKMQGQFADTKLTYIFQNETSERIEGDFLYTVPQNAVVTYFAYWFGEEKVVARVVEKERAAQIYQYITSRMRDPALVEMVGKNTFRARIFPIMPNADLRVEIHMAQVLPTSAKGAIFTLPLRGPEEGKGTFEDLNVEVEGVLDSAFSAVGNNFGQKMTIEGNRFRYQLQQKQYRAPRDLQIILTPRQTKLRAVVYARRASGSDGFFALALSPSKSLKQPKVTFSGVKTYDIAPRRLPSVAAGHTILVTGRYKGNGFATATLHEGKSQWKTLMQLSEQSEANNAATKLWAAQRIADLSGSARNKNAVMALSKRYTLPSKWTSWLAIPKAEAERYRREKAAADMDYYGRLLAVESAHGRGKSANAKNLRARFEQAAKDADYNTNLANWAASRLDSMSYNYEEATGRQKAQMKAEMRGLARLAGVNVNNYYNRARAEAAREREYEKTEAQMGNLSARLARELLQKGDTPRAQNLYRQLTSFARKSQRQEQDYMLNMVGTQAGELAKELVEQRLQEEPDRQRVARLEWRLKLLSKYTGNSVENWTEGAEQQKLGQEIYNEAQELVTLRHSEKPDLQRLAELEKKFALYKKRIKLSESALRSARWQWSHEEMHRAATLLADEKTKPKTDAARIADLQKQFDRALGEAPDTPKDATQKQTFAQHFHDLAQNSILNRALTQIQESLTLEATKDAAQRAMQIKAGRTNYARLHAAINPNTPNPLESSEVRVVLDAAEQKEKLENEQRQKTHDLLYQFMRWGDPLISIEAPADALQVIALLPGGEIKKLLLNGTKWQARFDIPTHAPEGDFPITVIIVQRDGTRRQMTLHFKVDVTAPQGQANIQMTDGKLRLDVSADTDTTRVSALLPWNQKVEMAASTEIANRFFALAEVPADWQDKALQITYVLTDKAHNRTTIAVDLEKQDAK